MLADHYGRALMTRNHRNRLASFAACAAGALALATFTVTPPAGASPHSAYVRVNQVGFATLNPDKRALLMSSIGEDGATFTVTDTATSEVVASGPVGADL